MGPLLLDIQWKARQQAYAQRFPDLDVVLVQSAGGDTQGSLIVHRGEEAIRLVDIVLRPEVRGQGLGTGLVRGLQAEAGRANLPLCLSVANGSPARRLYNRLGFRVASATETDVEMVWQPPRPYQDYLPELLPV